MMRNSLGIYHLFGENNKSKKLFYEWCKNDDNLCEYDLEHIAIDLVTPCNNNTDRYAHFSTANILDFLEEHSYYIGLPLRGNFKYVTCVYKKEENQKSVGMPFYNNSGIVGRTKSLEKGIQKAIEHLEKTL